MSIFKKYWFQILFFSIILIVFILISILLSSDCSCSSNKIGDSINCFINKTKDLWASIGSIATAISLIFIYYQLKVAQDQVRAAQDQVFDANLPNLLLNDSEFQISFTMNEVLILPSEDTKQYQCEHKVNLLGKYQGITLTNIGLGVAKNITSFWNYEPSLIINSRIRFFEYEIDKQNANYIAKDKAEILIPPYNYIAALCESEDAFLDNSPSLFVEVKNESTETPRNGEKIGLPFLLNAKKELTLKISFFDIYGRGFNKDFNVKVFGIVRGGSVNSYFIKMEFCEK